MSQREISPGILARKTIPAFGALPDVSLDFLRRTGNFLPGAIQTALKLAWVMHE